MTNEKSPTAGLTSAEVRARQEKYGKNQLTPKKKAGFFRKALHIIGEPMFLLLIAAAIIYFFLGEPRDGAIMLIFVVGIITIDVMQEWKTDRTLNALKDLSAPHITVIRGGKEQTVASVDLVPGDLMLLHEGVKIPADGVIIRCNDLCVDESSLTGEAEGVWKISTDQASPADDAWRLDYCYAGTLISQGTAVVRVDQIGDQTEYGKIGTHVAAAPQEATPLQKQTASLVRLCAVIAAILFLLVGLFTYWNSEASAFADRLIESILAGITLAMAMIPEEYPVVLTVFLSMGAWRLAKKQSLVRKLPSVETLGTVSVLCVDKTGTITMNQMAVQEIWALNGEDSPLIETMGLGCETDHYDPMEKAMLTFCTEKGFSPEHLFNGELVTEYAFTNELKMMGHVWRKNGDLIIAAKGSPERILTVCEIGEEDQATVKAMIRKMSGEGLRVIAIAAARPETEADIPPAITDCCLTFLGLIGLADPPRKTVADDIAICNRAGIRVVMITGDHGLTAAAIAEKIGMQSCGQIITGDMIQKMSDETLREKAKTCNIFSRVVPEQKMRIIKAFQKNGEIVAMTGDGVNDAPALKYADIGIAMGKRGSEVAREAADLILLDDNFTTIVETVKDGRRIYDNIRKAVGYIFTIHIPIAFSALLAPLLGIPSAALLILPFHVVLLELVIDPTCSIVLERQPAERNIMERPPRNPKEKLVNIKLLTKSTLQGIAVFVASFATYFSMLNSGDGQAETARAMGLSVIILANLLLVQVISSERDSVFRSARRLMKDKVMWLASTATVLMLILILYSPLNSFLKLAPLSLPQLLAVIAIAAAAVLWYEPVKLIKRMRS
ncbi:MAG TPA: cation-translocating P-type ATPase [Clostridiales bacterium]|nr:cation-translocating P-type ATPase [Clostridiales bacterium]